MCGPTEAGWLWVGSLPVMGVLPWAASPQPERFFKMSQHHNILKIKKIFNTLSYAHQNAILPGGRVRTGNKTVRNAIDIYTQPPSEDDLGAS